MILPNKHLKLNESLFGLGATVLDLLSIPQSIDQVWGFFENNNMSQSFEGPYHSFNDLILAIDFLYMLGAIKVDKNNNLSLCD